MKSWHWIALGSGVVGLYFLFKEKSKGSLKKCIPTTMTGKSTILVPVADVQASVPSAKVLLAMKTYLTMNASCGKGPFTVCYNSMTKLIVLQSGTTPKFDIGMLWKSAKADFAPAAKSGFMQYKPTQSPCK